jgi:hypothetical protein
MNIDLYTNKIALKVSNNGYDVSLNSIVLDVIVTIDKITVFPQLGYVTGGTPIDITFIKDYYSPIYCKFGNISTTIPVLAYKKDYKSHICISPKVASSVNMDLIIMTANLDVLYKTVYEYYDLPRLGTFLPLISQNGVQTDVTIYGTGFSLLTVGR